MDGRDLHRCIEGARRGMMPRRGLASLWRDQRPPAAGTAEECLKLARDPDRRFEPLRRGAGAVRPTPRTRGG